MAKSSAKRKPAKPVKSPQKSKAKAPGPPPRPSGKAAKVAAKVVKAPKPPPPPPPPKVLTLEERTTVLEGRLQKTDLDFQRRYKENLDMSWIYHDTALEGVVYTVQELRAAIDPSFQAEVDSSLQPVVEEIRRHREALEFIRDNALRRRQPITVDLVKKIYLILHPEEGDVKTVRYRKDIPQHRLYFHEYAAPDKITYKVRQIVDWINDPEIRRTRTPVRLAARAHYDLLRVFPFPNDSGKVARLLMNLLLLRSGLPPAIIHSTDRQRYYEALKGSSATMMTIVQEAIDNNLGSIEKLLDVYEEREEPQQLGTAP